MVNLDPWYVKYPLADIGPESRQVQADVARTVQQFQKAKTSDEITEDQLEDFQAEVERWESEKGFNQVSEMEDRARSAFILYQKNKDKLSRKQQAIAERQIDSAMKRTQEIADLYKRNKEIWEDKIKLINKEGVDRKKSMEELQKILETGDVKSRSRALNRFFPTYKVEPINKQETWTSYFKDIAWGEDKREYVKEDPLTGKVITTEETGISDKRAKKANEQVFENLEDKEKKQFKEEYEKSKSDKSFKEWAIDKYSPITAKEITEKEKYKKGKGIGLIIPKDEKGNAEWKTNDVTESWDVDKEKTYKYRSAGTLSLAGLDEINFPISDNDLYLATNKTEGESKEGYVGNVVSSKLQAIKFLPTATEKVKVPIKKVGPYTWKTKVFEKGDVIDENYLNIIMRENKQAQKIIASWEWKPWLMKLDDMRDVETISEGEPESRTHLVPYYGFAREKLLNELTGFERVDEEVRKKQKKLKSREEEEIEVYY